MTVNNVRLAHFEIQTVVGNVATNTLYANDRHQCKVIVLIAKAVIDDFGYSKFQALTAAERASLTITQYSTNPDAPLPSGWSCDVGKNEYDSGLWVRTQADEANSHSIQQSPQTAMISGRVEMLERFMRVHPAQPIQTQRFMARIQVAGKVYTTNFNDADGAFNSWVEILPQRPYILRVADLSRYVDIRAYEDATKKINVHVNYWKPPRGLLFFKNEGITNPLSVVDEGRLFMTSDANSGVGTFRKSGTVKAAHDQVQRIFMADIQRGIYSGDGPEVECDLWNTVMKAFMLQGGVTPVASRDTGHWRLIDNFGCEHKYRLKLSILPYSLDLTD